MIVISVKSYVAYPMSHHLSDPAIMADDVDKLGLFTLHTGRKAPISINLQINNKPVSLQLHTGAALSVMREKDSTLFLSQCLFRSSERQDSEIVPAAGRNAEILQSTSASFRSNGRNRGRTDQTPIKHPGLGMQTLVDQFHPMKLCQPSDLPDHEEHQIS
ncbi:hypothetical protein RRG08_038464 [Elysia crispata]|uniref:Uncharacterized protein n=1 Tax=Elysia crispata TaxID=231223 RepID=A0AAE0YXT4_9GAST|nr:hypothetical protein RRG08_038464 [Elysia crispata]